MPVYSTSNSSTNGDEATIEVEVRDDGGGGGGGKGGTGDPYPVEVVLTVHEGILKRKPGSGVPNIDHALLGLPAVRWRHVEVVPIAPSAPPGSGTVLEYKLKGATGMTERIPFVVVLVDQSGVPFFAEWGCIDPPLSLDKRYDPKNYLGPVVFLPGAHISPKDLDSK